MLLGFGLAWPGHADMQGKCMTNTSASLSSLMVIT